MKRIKRTWINCGALAVIVAAGAAMIAPPVAYAAEAKATCTIGDVTLTGDICTSDGKTCKCA